METGSTTQRLKMKMPSDGRDYGKRKIILAITFGFILLVLSADLRLIKTWTEDSEVVSTAVESPSELEAKEDYPSSEPVFKSLEEEISNTGKETSEQELSPNLQLLRSYGNTPGLPRSTSVEYNKLEDGEKYFVYTPSGGFNNQLICFITAIKVARELNRVLIVPQNGRHHNFFWRYFRLQQEDMVPMDQSLDFDFISEKTGVKLVPLNVTLSDFFTEVLGIPLEKPNKRIVRANSPDLEIITLNAEGLTRGSAAYHAKIFSMAEESKKKIVWIHGRYYTHRWETDEVRRRLRFAPFLRSFAEVVADEMFGGHYNGLHIRVGDKLKKETTGDHTAQVFVHRTEMMHFDRKVPVYLATDGDTDSKYYATVYAKYKKVVAQKDLAKNPVLQQWLLRYKQGTPDTHIRFDLFGLIEQMICVRSNIFVGSMHSTFSKTISKSREFLMNSAPDIYEEILEASKNHKIAPFRSSILVTFSNRIGYNLKNETETLLKNAHL